MEINEDSTKNTPLSIPPLTPNPPIRVTMILATDCYHGVACAGEIPWKCKEDMKNFVKLTTMQKDPTNAIPNIMIAGRKTIATLPLAYFKNTKRFTYGLTKDKTLLQGDNGWRACLLPNFKWVDSYEAIVNDLISRAYGFVYVIGGVQIYNDFLMKNTPGFELTSIDHTIIEGDFDCDEWVYPECNFVQSAFFNSGWGPLSAEKKNIGKKPIIGCTYTYNVRTLQSDK